MSDFRDKLIESAKRRKWCYLGYADFELPTWNDIFFNVENVRNRGESKWRRDPNLNFQMFDTRDISSVKYIQQYFQEIFHKNDVSSHVYFGISNERGALGLHKDKMDVIYMGAINNTRMTIWSGGKGDSNRKCLFDKEFKPLETIYIPAGTHHQIKVFEPRASLSFGVEGLEHHFPPEYL
jgi:hypothetical protein